MYTELVGRSDSRDECGTVFNARNGPRHVLALRLEHLAQHPTDPSLGADDEELGGSVRGRVG